MGSPLGLLAVLAGIVVPATASAQDRNRSSFA